MSNPADRSWAEEEKNFLLTEILKKAGIPPAYLFNLVRDLQIAPNWMDIPLPPGRSVISCQAAFRRMENEYGPVQYRHGFPGPGVSLQSSPGKRPVPPLSPSFERGSSAPRAIQPKPTLPATDIPPRSTSQRLESTTVDTTRKRKRGRPSKADVQERARLFEAAQALGEPYPPQKKSAARRTFAMQSSTVTGVFEPGASAMGPTSRQSPTRQEPSFMEGEPLSPQIDQPPNMLEGTRIPGYEAAPQPRTNAESGAPPLRALVLEASESTQSESGTASRAPASTRTLRQTSPKPLSHMREATQASTVSAPETTEFGHERQMSSSRRGT